MARVQLNPKDMTPAMGAYSHGIAIDVGESKLIFVTGQIPVDRDGKLVSDDVGEQTRFVFERIVDILADGGSSMKDVVKAQIFVTNIADFSVISPVRNEFFGESKPVSTLVEVGALVQPGCKVEIEVVAIVT
jgi:2-iminobutanoate/2-iminopropanoate deaminase